MKWVGRHGFTSDFFFFFLNSFCVKPYVPREPRRDPSNRRLNEHGIYIRHCQESNSQPVPSQAGADTTRPQWRTPSSLVLIAFTQPITTFCFPLLTRSSTTICPWMSSVSGLATPLWSAHFGGSAYSFLRTPIHNKLSLTSAPAGYTNFKYSFFIR